MIAYAGALEYMSSGKETKLEDSWVTQRFRTDDVYVSWRKDWFGGVEVATTGAWNDIP